MISSISRKGILMEKFKVAHYQEQGVALIIIPLEKEFGRKTPSE